MNIAVRASLGFVGFLIYVVLFATLYTFYLADDFTYSNVDLEGDYQVRVFEFEHLLEQKMHSPEFWQNSVKTDVRQISVEDLKWPIFRLYTHTPIANVDRLYPNPWYCEIEIFDGPEHQEEAGFSLDDQGNPIKFVISSVSCERLGKKPSESVLPNASIYKVFEFESRISFSENEWPLLNEVRYPNKGIKEGLFWRMFYFSAVTATTLGYGEILPFTDRARNWVTLQTITSLMIMGLIVWWISSFRPAAAENDEQEAEAAPEAQAGQDPLVLAIAQRFTDSAVEEVRADFQQQIDNLVSDKENLETQLAEANRRLQEIENGE